MYKKKKPSHSQEELEHTARASECLCTNANRFFRPFEFFIFCHTVHSKILHILVNAPHRASPFSSIKYKF